METSTKTSPKSKVRSYHEIVSSIDTLPVPPFAFEGEDPEGENACVEHVMKQLLQLSNEEYDIVVHPYGSVAYAAWSLAGLEGC